MSHDDAEQRVNAALTELGHKLVAGDLADLAVLAAKKQSGEEIVWMRSPIELLRLLEAFAEEFTLSPSNEFHSEFEAIADHELDHLAAVFLQLHQKISAEGANRRGKP